MNNLLPYADPQDESLDVLARHIWRSVVSETLPELRHYRHWVLSQPAKRLGGDFQLVADSWVAVGDVSGKGMPAALLTCMFVAAFKLAVRSPNPGKALEHALFNELESANMFITLAAAELGHDGWLSALNLGHPPVLVRRLSGEIAQLSASAPPVGTFRLPDYHSESVRLAPGELVCLYTDGLLEASKGDELFGLERLTDLLANHQEPEAAFRAILDELQGWALDDDLTLLLLQYLPERNWRDSHLDRR